MAAETWLSAEEALELGLADRVEQPVRMAAHFDFSRFRNPPPQLAALAASIAVQAAEATAEPGISPGVDAGNGSKLTLQPTAQGVDLDTVRTDERRATLAYAAELHELCLIANRSDLAAGFIAKATPVAQVRRALLEVRATEDEATAIRSQARPASVDPGPAAIDTAAIYAARDQHCR
jgi:hypothetical protein